MKAQVGDELVVKGRHVGNPDRTGSDRIRKELAGLPAETSARAPYGSGIYAAEWTERTYAELLHRAVVLLAHGESVIADAWFISAQQRPHGPEHVWRPSRPYMLPG